MLRRELIADGPHFCGGGRDGHALAQMTDHTNAPVDARGRRIDRQRQPRVDDRQGAELEVGRGDADHGMTDAGHLHGGAQHVRIATQHTRPIGVCQYDHRRGARRIVPRLQQPASDGSEAEDGEVLAGDPADVEGRRLPAIDQRRAVDDEGREIDGGLAARAIVGKVTQRDVAPLVAGARIDGEEDNRAIGMGDGEPAKHGEVRKREADRRRADRERQSADDQDRLRAFLEQCAQAVTNVAEQIEHHSSRRLMM